jgi:preprotein translocase subunit SecF
MFIIKHKKIFFGLTGLVLLLSFGATAFFGLKLGIDFTGGTLIEANCENTCAKEVLTTGLDTFELGEYSLRSAGDTGFVLRTKALEGTQREAVLAFIAEQEITVSSFSEVGPTIGAELRSKALWAMLLVIVAIILFIAFAFRPAIVKREETPEGIVKITRDSHGVSSWTLGVVAIIALMHDILVPVGVFSILGYFLGAEVGVLFVMALLAILGYSVNDTIVVFDRVREHLKNNADTNKKEDFSDTVGKALSETISRSINTSLTTLFVLLALYFVGPVVTQHFALTLIAGVIAGTYSSIFLASPLLVVIKKWQSQ